MMIIISAEPSPSQPGERVSAAGFESMADDDERRARACSIFGVIRFRLPGFRRPVILRHRLERTQEAAHRR